MISRQVCHVAWKNTRITTAMSTYKSTSCNISIDENTESNVRQDGRTEEDDVLHLML